jgi:hypothetical protein
MRFDGLIPNGEPIQGSERSPTRRRPPSTSKSPSRTAQLITFLLRERLFLTPAGRSTGHHPIERTCPWNEGAKGEALDQITTILALTGCPHVLRCAAHSPTGSPRQPILHPHGHRYLNIVIVDP